MKVCRICGEKKHDREFQPLKNFSQIFHARRVWCQDCMRMFVEMKKGEEQIKRVSFGFFCVRFE